MKEPLSPTLCCCLYVWLTSAAVSEHMSRANTARLSKWPQAGSKYFAETSAEGATLNFQMFFWISSSCLRSWITSETLLHVLFLEDGLASRKELLFDKLSCDGRWVSVSGTFGNFLSFRKLCCDPQVFFCRYWICPHQQDFGTSCQPPHTTWTAANSSPHHQKKSLDLDRLILPYFHTSRGSSPYKHDVWVYKLSRAILNALLGLRPTYRQVRCWVSVFDTHTSIHTHTHTHTHDRLKLQKPGHQMRTFNTPNFFRKANFESHTCAWQMLVET